MSRIADMIKAQINLGTEHQGKRKLERSKCKRNDNIKINVEGAVSEQN